MQLYFVEMLEIRKKTSMETPTDRQTDEVAKDIHERLEAQHQATLRKWRRVNGGSGGLVVRGKDEEVRMQRGERVG